MSFFDRQGIPESLVRLQPESKCKLSSELSNDYTEGDTSESDNGSDFEDDIMALRNYSFISISEDSSFFTMHRLVQLTTRAWLESHGRIEQWRERFISNLYHEFPTVKYEIWGECQLIFPHVRSALSQQPRSEDVLRKWATLLYKGALYAWQSGHTADVRRLANESMKERVKLFGAENEESLESTAMLATAAWLEGGWEEAEKLEVQVMGTRKMKLGEDHPATLTRMANLALPYQSQGRWEEAEKLEVQVLEASKTKLGENHPDTLTSMANLASTYLDQERWEEAEKPFVQVMETRKIKLGEDHPDTLTSMADLAFTCQYSAHDFEAINLLRDCFTKQKQILGLNHPTTLSNSETLSKWETERINMHAFR